MRITTLVVRRFKEWLADSVIPGADLAVIGIDLRKDETVERFLRENCLDLTYSECKKKVMEMYPSLFRHTYGDQEHVAMAQMAMSYHLGTSYIYQAFKAIYEKYEGMFKDGSIVDRWDETELVFIIDYMSAKYGCTDFDVRDLYDLRVLGFKVHDLGQASVEEALEQLKYMGYRVSGDRKEYISHFVELGVMGYRGNYYLVCVIRDYVGTVITSSRDPFIITNLTRRLAAIVY